jgi:Domain of unknown function (DUF6458)
MYLPGAERHQRRSPCQEGKTVIGIGVNVFLIVLGAILAFATHVSSSGIDLNVVGVVLIVAGLIGLLITFLIWGPRRRVDSVGDPLVDEATVVRRPVIRRRRVISQPSVVEERRVYEDPPRLYDDPPL